METAKGELLIFLDDDGCMIPGHVARLAEVLVKLPQTQTVSTGIRLGDLHGKPVGQAFDMPFALDGGQHTLKVQTLCDQWLPAVQQQLFDVAILVRWQACQHILKISIGGHAH